MDVREEQFAKALAPIEVTDWGIVTALTLVNSLNAFLPMLVTPSLITISFTLLRSLNQAGKGPSKLFMFPVPLTVNTPEELIFQVRLSPTFSGTVNVRFKQSFSTT